MNMFKSIMAAGALLLGGTVAANAIPVGFGLSVTGISVTGNLTDTNGNCYAGVGPCYLLNGTHNVVLQADAGYTFSLLGFKYRFTAQGSGATPKLSLYFNDAATAEINLFDTSSTTNDYEWLGLKSGLVKVVFEDEGGGRVGLNGLNISQPSNVNAAVPLPAASLLLVGGLGGLAALKRRKKAA